MHTLTAAAGRRFDEEGEPDREGGRGEFGVAETGIRDPGHDRYTTFADLLLGADLVAHHREGLHARSDEDEVGRGAGFCELRILGEKSVAGVHCLRARLECRLNDAGDVEVAIGGIGGTDPHGHIRERDVTGTGIRVTIDGDRADAERAQRTDDSAGDLAAIGDEHGVEHGGMRSHRDHIRKTP